MRLRRLEPHTLVGAYAMDAVAGPDQARFERHLARCQACARELAELREATARLAGAVAAEPPGDLVERVVALAARTRQLPPAAAEPAAWWRALRARQPGSIEPGRLPAHPRLRPTPLPRLALALAAVFLAAAAASGVVALKTEHRLSTVELRDHEIAQVLSAPDAIMLTARIKPRGTATVVMSHRYRSLVLTTAGLPPLPTGRSYQLWLMGPSGDRSAGMLPAPHGGMTSPVIATGLAAGDRVGLTIAPENGSPHAASASILILNLAT